MFVLHEMNDTIRVPPDKFGYGEKYGKEILAALVDEKYSNRVVPSIGLCITLYDFMSIGMCPSLS